MAITTQDIHAAADRLAAEGQQPTLAAVRSALGGGSFTTISEAMKVWKAAQQSATAPIREVAPAAVAERMAEVAGEVWSIAQGMANDRLASEREALDAARQEMEQAQAEAAELADQLASDLDTAKAVIEQQAQAAALQAGEIERQAADAARLNSALSVATTAASTAEASLAEVRTRVDQLSHMNDAERAERIAAEKRAGEAERQVAVLESRLDAALKAEDAANANAARLAEKAVAAEQALNNSKLENNRLSDSLSHQAELNSILKQQMGSRIVELERSLGIATEIERLTAASAERATSETQGGN